jgi:tRNA-adenosine deaminase (EC 3.5.4.-)
MDRDRYFMELALEEAKKGEKIWEVPVGCVIVKEGEVIAKAHNLKETRQNSIYHAEMLAIHEACQKLGSWRLDTCELYVTLEPCPMCAGAMMLSRLKRVVYGTPDPRAGCAGTLMNLLQDIRFNHRCEVISGVLQEECSKILVDFFKAVRARIRQEKAAGKN